MKIYEVIVSWWFEANLLTELVLIPGKCYSDAVANLEKEYENDISEFSIRELENPVVLDTDILTYWNKKCEELKSKKEN